MAEYVDVELASGSVGRSGNVFALVRGTAALAQRIKLRILRQLGEDVFQPSVGLPWVYHPEGGITLTEKGVSDDLLRSMLWEVVSDTPGVSTVDYVTVTASDTQARSRDVEFSVNAGQTTARVTV